jgi:pimeloyl-ACP methyl ester carboxylesterase
MKIRLIFISVLTFASAIVLLFGCSSVQRKLLYFPSHQPGSNGLTEWRHQGQLIGFAREVPSPKNVWLLIHGNGGQAAHMVYAMPRFSVEDSVFILEYPGYGLRNGTPSMKSFNDAALQAYEVLRERFPDSHICVVGESIGTGPTSFLTTCSRPPDKVVLIVPYDELAKVAAKHYPFLPVRLLLRDNWNNITALTNYRGPLEIFAATNDSVIPIAHAKTLAATKPNAIFHEIPGGHSDWSQSKLVNFRYP